MKEETSKRLQNGFYAFIGSLTTVTSVLVSEMDSEDVPRLTRAFFRFALPISALIGITWGISSKGKESEHRTRSDLREAITPDIIILAKKINERRKFGYHTPEKTYSSSNIIPFPDKEKDAVSSAIEKFTKRDDPPPRAGFIRKYYNGAFSHYEPIDTSESDRMAEDRVNRRYGESLKKPISYRDLKVEKEEDSGFDPVEDLDRMDREYLKALELAREVEGGL